MDLYQKYIALSRYSRFRPDLGRRETWEETVDRLMSFWAKQLGDSVDEETFSEVRSAILNLEVMPSMRTLMAAGPALERDHMAAYNCSANTISSPVIEIWNEQIKESGHEKPIKVSLGSPVVFDNILYILLCGTGVGFSAERQFVNTLPVIGEPMSRAIYQANETNYPRVPEHEISTFDNSTIRVADSKYGWASALRILIVELYNGNFDVQYDTSKVRKAGTPLKTFGGRASGPEPLREMFDFIKDVFKQANGRKLNSVECHDIVCKIAASVVVGGVRRSALISLSNLSDDRMRHAKSGAWWENNSQRALANNSVAYTEKPDIGVFMREWEALYESKSGERGIFNRNAAKKKCESIGRNPNHDWLTNPCSEIILRPAQTCNLSEIVVRQDDNLESLKRKVRIAAILGTWQSTLTNFAYLIPLWKENCDEERLLGVSLTGLMDHPVLAHISAETKSWLNEMRDFARETNAEWAKKLGINASAAITCVKPSGCRPWNALTTTDKGILTLEELFDEHPSGEQWAKKSGVSAILPDGNSTSITKTYDNSVSELRRVTLSYGVTLDCTPNHQWFVKEYKHPNAPKRDPINDWVATKDLRPGDVIETHIGTYRNETHAKLCSFDQRSISMRGDAAPIKQPEQMNEDLAWLLGYLWGDGAMSPGGYRIRFIDAETLNLEKAQRIIKEQFGIDSTLKSASQKRRATTLEIGNKNLWHWLIKNGVWKYFNDKLDVIPKVVRSSAWTDIVAFMAGMFDADGCVGVQNGQGIQTFSSADEDFSRHFQSVGWAVGLCFGLSKNVKGDNLQKQKSMFLLSLGSVTDREAFERFKLYSLKVSRQAESIDQFRAVDATKGLIPGKVTSVDALEPAPTFDIETESHWYMAGAFKSHNTVSQLVDSASGLHPRYAQYYIRRVRADSKDPLAKAMKEAGFPCEPDVMQPSNVVFSFPVKAPKNAVMRDDRTAIEQLEYWKLIQDEWCEHKPSVTIYVREHEWLEVGAWVYKNFDSVSGVSFLPHSDHSYMQAPYEECSWEQYETLKLQIPSEIPMSRLSELETSDMTTSTQELSCTGGMCELV